MRTVFAYHGRDRLTSVDAQSECLVTAFEYDAAGNVTKVIDPKVHETVDAYDLLSPLESVTQHLGQSVIYRHDGRGRLWRVVNARGNALDYGYFSWGVRSRWSISRPRPMRR